MNQVVRYLEINGVTRIVFFDALVLLLVIVADDKQVACEHVIAIVVNPDGGGVGCAIGFAVGGEGDAQRCLVENGILGDFCPLVEFVVGAGGEADARVFAQAPIRDGGDARFVNEDAAAENARINATGFEGKAMVSPMNQIVARDVRPAMAFFGLDDVHEVIATFPKEGRVGVEGAIGAFGCDDVILGAIWIGE